MSKRADREGLSLAYRVGYRIRYVTLHVFGPAQLGGGADPHRRLQRERAARVEAARRARLENGGSSGR
jgi:hypothetical protein